jgi:hypothetical protein
MPQAVRMAHAVRMAQAVGMPWASTALQDSGAEAVPSAGRAEPPPRAAPNALDWNFAGVSPQSRTLRMDHC